jgi:ribosomal 30S subunit maturation factor RimM
VLDYSNNPLLQVFSNGFEVLIPITDVFVKRVDKKARVVHVEVPSELLEMNKM